jgi:hypothetical protein
LAVSVPELLMSLLFSPEIALPFFASASAAGDPQRAAWQPPPMGPCVAVASSLCAECGIAQKLRVK